MNFLWIGLRCFLSKLHLIFWHILQWWLRFSSFVSWGFWSLRKKSREKKVGGMEKITSKALFSHQSEKNVIEKISAFLHFSFFCIIRFDFIYLTFVWRFSHFTLNSPFQKEQYNLVTIYISFLWMIKMLTAIVFITSIHSWPRNCTLYNWTIISKVVHLSRT